MKTGDQMEKGFVKVANPKIINDLQNKGFKYIGETQGSLTSYCVFLYSEELMSYLLGHYDNHDYLLTRRYNL